MSSHWVEKGVASGHRTLPDHGQSVGQSTGSNQVVVDGTIKVCALKIQSMSRFEPNCGVKLFMEKLIRERRWTIELKVS